MRHLLFFISCVIFFVTAKGQSNYSEAMKQGDDAFNKGQYKIAINKYFAAEAFDPSKKEIVKEKVNKAFDRIEALKKKAEGAEKQATIAKKETENALNKAQKLIDAFYFYENRFALAFKDANFYFIDKEGNEIEKLGKWDNAEQFGMSGYAKVKKSENGRLLDYVVDTFGNFYRAAYNISDLDSTIKAVDLVIKAADSASLPLLIQYSLQVLILRKANASEYININRLLDGITSMRDLEHLQLPGWGIRNLPGRIGALKNLRFLNLAENALTTLPDEIVELKKLTTLVLTFNEIKRLPAGIEELENLISLRLNYNRLDSLPRQIGELRSLSLLDLNFNTIKSLPAEIGRLKNLTILFLYFNRLNDLPPQIGELKSLSILTLQGNQLKALPPQIGELTNLITLNLEHNQLINLPPEIGKLKQLKTLILTRNKLTTLPTEVNKLKNLKNLYLGQNPISMADQNNIGKILPGDCEIKF